MSNNDQIASIVSRVALVVALVIAIALPLGYGVIAFSDLSADLQFKAKVKATAFSSLVTSNPDLWIYAENRMQGLLAREPVPLETEWVQVYDLGGVLITQAGQTPAPPVLSRSYLLYDAVRVAGRIEVSASLRGLIYGIAAASAFGLLLGAAVFTLMRVVPLRALRQAIYALMDSEERFRALVQAADSAIVVLDREGYVLAFNRAAEKFYSFRFQPGDPVSAEFLELLRFDGDGSASGGSQSSESTFRTLDGDERTLLWNVSRFADEANEGGGVVLLGQDITERKNLENALRQSEELLRLALDSAAMGIWHWQPDNDEFSASAQARQLHGLDPDAVISRDRVLDALHPDDRNLVIAALQQAIKSGELFDVEVRVPHPDGRVHWLASRGRWVSGLGNAPGRLIGVVQDATQHKQLEETLVHAKQQAEWANQAKSDFLSMMSHELRSPMTGVLGTLSLLLQTVLDQEQTQYAQIAHDSARALLTLLNDILDMAKLEAGKITIESLNFDLSRLVDEVIHLMAVSAANKGIDLVVNRDASIPRFLHGDAIRIRQIMLNLIGNAIKFTKAGGVTVTVSYESGSATGNDPFHAADQGKPAEGWLKIAVTDTGIGIPPEIQPRLFKRFSQADSSISRNYGGTGLGLAICKQLCELMGGHIGVQSTAGLGSTFWFTVRCGLGEEPAAHTAESGAAATESLMVEKRHILIAEDSSINQIIIKAILGKAGHTLEIVNNGREAVQAVMRTQFDLILMDVQMPEMDGISATQAIRALPPPQSSVPIIALTANAMREQQAEYLDAGMDDYVSKPFTDESLIGTISRLFARLSSVGTGRSAPVAEDVAEVMAKNIRWQDLSVFDESLLEGIRQYTGGDAAFHSLLEQLSAAIAGSIEQSHAAWQSGDLDQIRNIAHRLKGEASTFGAQRVAAIATILNETTDPATVNATLSDLDQAYQDTVAAIQIHLQN